MAKNTVPPGDIILTLVVIGAVVGVLWLCLRLAGVLVQRLFSRAPMSAEASPVRARRRTAPAWLWAGGALIAFLGIWPHRWTTGWPWGLLLVVVVVLILRRSGAATPKSMPANTRLPMAPASATQARTPLWSWAVVVTFVLLAIAVPVMVPKPRSILVTWSPVLFLVVVVTIVIAVAFVRNFDSGLNHAFKRFRAGDQEGAITDLRELVEDKGPTQARINALGLMLFQREQWDEAAALFRKGEELGEFKGLCRANLGVALLKAGKPEEALPVLQDAAGRAAGNRLLTCIIALNTSLALAAVGRRNEAWESFLSAEEISDTLPSFQRKAAEKQVESCRVELLSQLPSQEKLEPMEEI
jgi:hypothetical protein